MTDHVPNDQCTVKELKNRIWNCWTANYRPKEDGYVTHAFEEFLPKPDKRNTGRALCGVRTAEGGGLNLHDEWEPGCIRCRNILRKRGLMPPKTIPTFLLS